MITKSNGLNLPMILIGLLAAYVGSPVDLFPGPVDDGAILMLGLPILMLIFGINSVRRNKK